MRQRTIDRIRKFSDDRDWDQFHSPENLAKSISIEAAELLECFQWNSDFNMDDEICTKYLTANTSKEQFNIIYNNIVVINFNFTLSNHF